MNMICWFIDQYYEGVPESEKKWEPGNLVPTFFRQNSEGSKYSEKYPVKFRNIPVRTKKSPDLISFEKFGRIPKIQKNT